MTGVKDGQVEVDKDDLDVIAANCNKEYATLGIAVHLTLGHTLDHSPGGSEVPEEEQPDIIGWSVNYKTGKLPNGEDALYCYWYVRREHADKLKQYPTRSVEYYPSRQMLWPIALLKSSAPELALPILRYRSDLKPEEEQPYRTTLTTPLTYERDSMNPRDNDKEKDMDKKEPEKKEKDAPKKGLARSTPPVPLPPSLEGERPLPKPFC